jgi:hypothetical protein
LTARPVCRIFAEESDKEEGFKEFLGKRNGRKRVAMGRVARGGGRPTRVAKRGKAQVVEEYQEKNKESNERRVMRKREMEREGRRRLRIRIYTYKCC